MTVSIILLTMWRYLVNIYFVYSVDPQIFWTLGNQYIIQYVYKTLILHIPLMLCSIRCSNSISIELIYDPCSVVVHNMFQYSLTHKMFTFWTQHKVLKYNIKFCSMFWLIYLDFGLSDDKMFLCFRYINTFVIPIINVNLNQMQVGNHYIWNPYYTKLKYIFEYKCIYLTIFLQYKNISILCFKFTMIHETPHLKV